MSDLNKTCKTLLKALHVNGANLLFGRREFMGKEGKPHTMFMISKAYWDDEAGKYSSRKVYESASLIRIVLYLWFDTFKRKLKALPMDNEYWNQVRPEDLLTVDYKE